MVTGDLPFVVDDDSSSNASQDDSKLPGTPEEPSHNHTEILSDNEVNINAKGKKPMTSSIIQMI